MVIQIVFCLPLSFVNKNQLFIHVLIIHEVLNPHICQYIYNCFQINYFYVLFFQKGRKKTFTQFPKLMAYNVFVKNMGRLENKNSKICLKLHPFTTML